MVMHNGLQRTCANPECQDEIVCRRCGLGTMLKRKNKDGGVFYGCNHIAGTKLTVVMRTSHLRSTSGESMPQNNVRAIMQER